MSDLSAGFPIQRRCSCQLILASLLALALAGHTNDDYNGDDDDDDDDDNDDNVHKYHEDNDDNALHIMRIQPEPSHQEEEAQSVPRLQCHSK